MIIGMVVVCVILILLLLWFDVSIFNVVVVGGNLICDGVWGCIYVCRVVEIVFLILVVRLLWGVLLFLSCYVLLFGNLYVLILSLCFVLLDMMIMLGVL